MKLTPESKDEIKKVKKIQSRFVSGMDAEIKGYRIEACSGRGGCPNLANESASLFKQIEELLAQKDLIGFLKRNLKGSLKFHHEFRVALADCPNSCSQPQIKDIGIIGAVMPAITEEPCSLCEECVAVCKDKAIRISNLKARPEINTDLCLMCGLCVKACPTGAISEGERGFRVQIGGKLGRRPRLARELPGIYNEADVLNIINRCIEYYLTHSKHGQRFAEIIEGVEINQNLYR
jgi:dissimilatory sulfite reductase (desulfoviridin) alpha/beta subunit